MKVFYEIVDFFVLDMCSKPIALLEVAGNSKSRFKRQKLLKSCRGHGKGLILQ